MDREGCAVGSKWDGGKARWSLLPYKQVKQIVDVLTIGAIKYDDNNWQTVTPLRDRYFSAMMRHITAWAEGEKYDTETKLHSLAHAGCCLLFLMWGDDNAIPSK